MAQLTFEEIRNEAIQMFRDMPDNLREQLLTNLREDPQLPPSLVDPDDDFGARALFVMIPRSKSEPNWAELNGILATVYVNDHGNHLDVNTVESLYRLIHAKLLALGQVPAAGARDLAPPVLPWLAARVGHRRYPMMAKAAGLTLPLSAPSAPAAGTGGKRSRFRKRKSKHKSRKHRKTLNRESLKRKSRKH